ncbi:EpsG family protein [Lactiplantibacillus carotarum]|uniref:EpsG family protein n=1 Tax=Lactiplantibacillus carotarum TaxID=2993456 RepID=UPI00298F165B|nr:EpsG family protein [Lactiplantibacillus carotarum]
MPTSIIAGVRNLSIGTDIQHYVITNFSAALTYNNLYQYLAFIHTIKTNYVGTVNHTEIGYSILTYSVSRLSSNVHWLLFALQFATVLFIYVSLVRYSREHKISIVFGMFVYYMLFYGQSLNLMRQTLAASIVLFAVSYLIENKFLLGTILIFFAAQFHTSAYVALIFVYILWRWNKKTVDIEHDFLYKKFGVLIILYLCMLLIGPYIFKLLQIIITYLPVFNKYTPSFAVSTSEGYRYFGTTLFVISDLIVIGIYSSNKHSDPIEASKITRLFYLTMVFSTGLYAMYRFQTVIPRLAIYFSIFRIPAYSYFIEIEDNPFASQLMRGLVILVLIYLFVHNLLSGNGAIYPYASQIIEQLWG